MDPNSQSEVNLLLLWGPHQVLFQVALHDAPVQGAQVCKFHQQQRLHGRICIFEADALPEVGLLIPCSLRSILAGNCGAETR